MAASDTPHATHGPTPIERAIALLETFAESGMEASDFYGQKTPNARYCLETAADLKALSAVSETPQSRKTSTWLAAAFEDMCQALPDAVSSRLHSDIDAIHEILSSPSATQEFRYKFKDRAALDAFLAVEKDAMAREEINRKIHLEDQAAGRDNPAQRGT